MLTDNEKNIFNTSSKMVNMSHVIILAVHNTALLQMSIFLLFVKCTFPLPTFCPTPLTKVFTSIFYLKISNKRITLNIPLLLPQIISRIIYTVSARYQPIMYSPKLENKKSSNFSVPHNTSRDHAIGSCTDVLELARRHREDH